ncbi:hypothetical protein [Streptomyces candidus]|uniref:Uncharacterized protein n=1 Tax=Streptomyces candidus TaxID=67283 RepID=A0A7X0LT30_9ACTN|nr:hypothetical protein [Streptomyces candidus]MBB6439890.1 hypothetical protein [Streptomyces candidus]GHH58075.1 hypothetical protein GCM10018773_66070 [Streptomyces candidus]
MSLHLPLRPGSGGRRAIDGAHRQIAERDAVISKLTLANLDLQKRLAAGGEQYNSLVSAHVDLDRALKAAEHRAALDRDLAAFHEARMRGLVKERDQWMAEAQELKRQLAGQETPVEAEAETRPAPVLTLHQAFSGTSPAHVPKWAAKARDAEETQEIPVGELQDATA